MVDRERMKEIRRLARLSVRNPEAYWSELGTWTGPDPDEVAERERREAAFWLEQEDRGITSVWELDEPTRFRLMEIQSGIFTPEDRRRRDEEADLFAYLVKQEQAAIGLVPDYRRAS